MDISFYLIKNIDLLKNNIVSPYLIKWHWNKFGEEEKRVGKNKDKGYIEYEENDYILEYIKHDLPRLIYTPYIEKLNTMDYFDKTNRITVNPSLYYYIYNDQINEKENIFYHIYEQGVTKGYFYSLRQLENYLGKKVKLYWNENNLFIYWNNEYIELKKFITDIYQKSYKHYIEDIIILEDNIIEISSSIVVLFIGNIQQGKKLITKLAKSDRNHLSFLLIFKSHSDYYKLKIEIQYIENKIIFISKEYGNDIIPSLQSMHYILNKHPSVIKYIYKIHTKSNSNWLDTSVDYLLLRNEQSLIDELNNNLSNCVGSPLLNINFKIYLSKNMRFHLDFCKNLINVNKNLIDTKKNFIAGTIFFTESSNIKKIFDFIKSNTYQSYFLNNMYDNNFVNLYTSPYHFIERLFGVIK